MLIHLLNQEYANSYLDIELAWTVLKAVNGSTFQKF